MDSTFENLKFNPFHLNNNILLNNLTDPDVNLFNENQNMDTPYLDINEAKNKLGSFNDSNSFHILHLNIRSLNKNFEKLKLLLAQLSHNFSIICLTETWCTNDSFINSSNFQLPNYNSAHFERTKQ